MDENAEEWGGETCQRAKAFYLTFHEFNYNYFINVFSYTIFRSAAILKYYQTNINCCLKKIKHFQEDGFPEQ